MREALLGSVRAFCVCSLPEQPSLLPPGFTGRSLWNCQDARTGPGSQNSKFLSGPDAGGKPWPALRTSPDQVPRGMQGQQVRL